MGTRHRGQSGRTTPATRAADGCGRAVCARLVVLALLWSGLPQTAWPQTPSFIQADIGGEIAAANPVTTYSTALRVNAQGDAVGWALINGETRAFFYNPLTGPVLLPLSAGRPGNRALGLNDRDANGLVLVAGSSLAGSFDDPGLAVLWRVNAQSGAVTETLEIGALPGFTAGLLTAVNNRGVAVGYSIGTSTGQQIMTYDTVSGVLAPLDFPARPTDVNNQDQLVGRNFRGDLNGGPVEDLGLPDDHSLADLAALNDQGWTTGYAVSANGDGAGRRIKDIVRYRADWDVLGGLSAFDGGEDINFQGDVVGRYGGPSSPALYLESEGQLFLLEDLLADAGDTVSEANGINDGRVIAGVGSAGAALLIPDAPPPPPPPLAPDNLVASASATETAIAISWTDNSNDEDGFSLERAPAGSGNWQELTATALTEYTDLTVVPAASYDYRVRAYGAGGNSAYSNTDTATAPGGGPPPDTEAPVVFLQSPADGERISGLVTVLASATDNVGVAQLQVTYAGNGGGTVCTTAADSLNCSWNVDTLTPGAYILAATATDAAGNTATMQISVTVDDVASPVVSFADPADGAQVAGNVNVSATADDNVGVTQLAIAYSGNGTGGNLCVGASDSIDCVWDTRSLLPGPYMLTATATDAAGNSATSQISVTLLDTRSPVVTFTSPADGAQVSGTVTVSASATDDVGVTQLEIAYGGVSICSGASDSLTCDWATGALLPGPYMLTATATDGAGNSASSQIGVTALDTRSPVVAFTSPADGAQVSGTVTVSAGATDDVGVTQFEIAYGGGILCSSAGAALSCEWDATLLAPGAHVLTATASDAAGNNGTSQVMVDVVAPPPSGGTDSQPPQVTIVSPAAAAQLSGVVSVRAGATDDVGVAILRADYTAAHGSDTICSAIGSGLLECVWDVAAFAPGDYQLRITAEDAAGNVGEAVVQVTLLDVEAPVVTLSHQPAQGPVAGVVTLTARASDNVGVVDLAVEYAGAASGGVCAIRGSGELNCRWMTDGLAAGTYQLIATASDAAGNQGSATVSVETAAADVADTPADTPVDDAEESVASALSWWLILLGLLQFGPWRGCAPRRGSRWSGAIRNNC